MLMLALIRNKKMLVDRWPQKTGFVFAKKEIKSASIASANQLLPCPIERVLHFQYFQVPFLA